jgi:NDP-sugar pyrophosphorylase family protein
MQAVILAGGKGTHMKPFTDTAPKSMVPIGGIPLINWQLRALRENGITDVVVYGSNTTPNPDEFQNHIIAEGSTLGMAIKYKQLEFKLGSRGVIQDALENTPRGENILVVYGDIFFGPAALEPLMETQLREHPYATFLVKKRDSSLGELSGVGEEGSQRVTGLAEKPVLLSNTAVLTINSVLLDRLKRGELDETDFSTWMQKAIFKGENPRFPEGPVVLMVPYKEGGLPWENVSSMKEVRRLNNNPKVKQAAQRMHLEGTVGQSPEGGQSTGSAEAK